MKSLLLFKKLQTAEENIYQFLLNHPKRLNFRGDWLGVEDTTNFIRFNINYLLSGFYTLDKSAKIETFYEIREFLEILYDAFPYDLSLQKNMQRLFSHFCELIQLMDIRFGGTSPLEVVDDHTLSMPVDAKALCEKLMQLEYLQSQTVVRNNLRSYSIFLDANTQDNNDNKAENSLQRRHSI